MCYFHTSAFFLLADSKCSVNNRFFVSALRISIVMAGEGEKTTIELSKEMQQQMVSLQTQVNEMQQQQKQQSTAVDHKAIEDKDGLGYLVEHSETIKSFLEAAFSAIIVYTNHKKWLDRIGVPDCDSIRCPKLDQVLQSIIPSDAIKADGYLSRLQQFWLDAVTPLTALLESAEGGELETEDTVTAVQSALYFLGNAHQQLLVLPLEVLNEPNI